LAPEKATAGTAKPHLQAAKRDTDSALTRTQEALFALQRIMPAVVEVGKAKYRARVNSKRYNTTAEALEERRKGRKADKLQRRKDKGKDYLDSLRDDDD